MTKKTEISYALRNFIENSIKFAKNKINIEIDQSKKRTAITISDDGDGFNKDIIANLGQPYLHSDNIKKNKKGMGLGVFISKSLLERCLAQVTFRNNKSLPGASVKIVWNNSQLENL